MTRSRSLVCVLAAALRSGLAHGSRRFAQAPKKGTAAETFFPQRHQFFSFFMRRRHILVRIVFCCDVAFFRHRGLVDFLKSGFLSKQRSDIILACFSFAWKLPTWFSVRANPQIFCGNMTCSAKNGNQENIASLQQIESSHRA